MKIENEEDNIGGIRKINGGREAAKNRQQQKQIAEKQLPIFIISRSIYYWAAAVY